MSDDDIRETVAYLRDLTPEQQAQKLNGLEDDEKGRILASFSAEEQNKFIDSPTMTLHDRLKYSKLVKEHSAPPEAPQKQTSNKGVGVKTDNTGGGGANLFQVTRANSEITDFYVSKIRELIGNSDIWVCEVMKEPTVTNSSIKVGQQVFVQKDMLFNPGILAKPPVPVKQYPPHQRIRIGSWNIRCTHNFKRLDAFFCGLLVRFKKLAHVICKSECDIVALQELPMSFRTTNEFISIRAENVLPELIRSLDDTEEENGSNDKWSFAYSEDFPQYCWYKHRNVKSIEGKIVDHYPKNNGEYIHAFVFKKNKIICHSVEQILDLTYQENRFKHAPSLGRFTFIELNFHFSLCNVHMRPESKEKKEEKKLVPAMDSRHEIEDLGECIPYLRRYNPDSTIFLGDWNSSAQEYAPEDLTLNVNQRTHFPPYVPNVWDKFRDDGYTSAIKNCFTNVGGTYQYDNIWIPEALEDKRLRDVELHQPTSTNTKVRPQSYERTKNVVYLTDIFRSSTSQDIITFVSDHNLIYLDLEIERKEDNPLIEKICEINCCSTDREYAGTVPSKSVGAKRKLKEADTESEITNASTCGVEERDKKGRKRKSNEPVANDSKLARPIPDDVSSIASNETSNIQRDKKGRKRKSNEPVANDSKLARPIPDDVSSIASNETSNIPYKKTAADITRERAKKNYKIWDKTKKKPNMKDLDKDLGDKLGCEYWSKSLFPPNFTVQSNNYQHMKELEKDYKHYILAGNEENAEDIRKKFIDLAEKNYNEHITRNPK